MGFKTDWSFLDKISMGAVGTEAVIEQLNQMGHRVIELERYCTSNKIWATKIKRLRIPDLLCLRCGKRIESRAKSKLGIIMSDSEKNEDRRWFCGLRDTDWVAFIQCSRDAENKWCASEAINLFSVGGMKEVESEGSAASNRKSESEGRELDRRWRCYVPGWHGKGTIVAIDDTSTDQRRLRMQSDDGQSHSYKVKRNQYVYVKQGDTFAEGERILAGVVPPICNCGCSNEQYDFFVDLSSTEKETVYTAVKALGYLPASELTISELQRIANDPESNGRIRLEAFASLLRLGVDAWEQMYQFAFSSESIELKMEYVLILGEISVPEAAEFLFRVLQNSDNPDELRAAAVWSLPPTSDALSRAIPYCFDPEWDVAKHAMAKIKRHFSREMTELILSAFCDDDHRNATCAFLLSTAVHVDSKAVVSRYLSSDGKIRDWILYTMGISPEESYSELISKMDPSAHETKSKLMLLWNCQPMYLTGSEMDDVMFLEKQK